MKPQAPAALMVIIRMGIVMKLVESSEPKTAKNLSIGSGGDELLIGKILRYVLCDILSRI